MTPSELTAGTTRWMAAGAVPVAAAAGWLDGAPGAVGVVAGCALANGTLRWFARLAVRHDADGGVAVSPWLVTTGLRFAAVSAIAAALFVAGWAHPVALLAGYTLLPLAVVVAGLAPGRQEVRS